MEGRKKSWQLAGYDGKGSYKYLMDTYNMTDNDAGIQSAPLSFLRGGDFGWSSGNLYNRCSDGYYWESRVYSSSHGYSLYFYSTSLNPQYYNTKGYGRSLRCIVRIPPSHK